MILGPQVLGGGPLQSSKCSALLSSQSLLDAERSIFSRISVGFLNIKTYRTWQPKVSSVAIKHLIHRYNFGADRIMMGAALITEDLVAHYHSAPEIYYVLKGRGKMILGSGEEKIQLDLKPRRFVYLPPNITHYTVVDSKDPLEIIYIFPRNHLDQVKYQFDEKERGVSFGEKDVLERTIIGDIPQYQWKYTTHEKLVEGREKGERGLMMEHSVLFSQDFIQGEGSPHIFFIRQGYGLIRLGDGEKVPLRLGFYVYVREGETYLIENLSSEGLDFLSFRPLEEK